MMQRFPFVGRSLARWSFALRSHRSNTAFSGSADYWDERYAAGGDSGRGSYGRDAAFKADVLNRFVATQHVQSVIEFGCGDGNQLSLGRYPQYLGLDVSSHAVDLCRQRFSSDATKAFHVIADYAGETADLALSLDVIYHLVEDATFDAHMRTLFSAADRFVIVFSTNVADQTPLGRAHVRHRKFTDWVDDHAREWVTFETVENPLARKPGGRLLADFHMFARAS